MPNSQGRQNIDKEGRGKAIDNESATAMPISKVGALVHNTNIRGCFMFKLKMFSPFICHGKRGRFTIQYLCVCVCAGGGGVAHHYHCPHHHCHHYHCPHRQLRRCNPWKFPHHQGRAAAPRAKGNGSSRFIESCRPASFIIIFTFVIVINQFYQEGYSLKESPSQGKTFV